MKIKCDNCGYEYNDEYAISKPISNSAIAKFAGTKKAKIMMNREMFILDEADIIICPVCASMNNTGNKKGHRMEDDFLKWLCKKAGFYWNDEECSLSYEYEKGLSLIATKGTLLYENVIYPLLLQKAFEGINIENNRFKIIQTYETVFIMIDDSLDPINHRYFDFAVPQSVLPVNIAKEKALKYIYEQEKK
ncbi:MAG: hypothetical protein PF693_21585 [Spirochaetia bacterium]|jgi:transposase-like protein|nr:hypothetical protein [Spirochaetia bacterium]